MTTAQTNDLTPRKPIRLWPGVVAVVLQWLAMFVVPRVVPDLTIYGMIGGTFIGGLAVILWWLFFSRAPWSERVGALVLVIVAVFATRLVVHKSIATGHMGLTVPLFSVPFWCLALVASVAAGRRLSTARRRASMIAAILLAFGLFTFVRSDGIRGEGGSDLHWRWTPTPEERLLAQARDEALDSAQGRAPVGTSASPAAGKSLPAQASDQPAAPTSAPAASATVEKPLPTKRTDEPKTSSAAPATGETPKNPGPATAAAAPTPAADPSKPKADWPGFRGPARDGVVRGVPIESDWSRKPPVELWRRPIGPAWSSFAVRGDLVYTQEQRGEDEVVSCYRLTTGEPVWRHKDAIRFWESNAGPGPRGTPTINNGRVYTVGATGLVNALDAGNGTRIWSHNAVTDTGKKIPDWGIASSPLVVDDVVIVAVAGQLIAYDAATGKQRWLGETGGGGYSSPHLATIGGVPQVLLIRGSRTISVAPADGALLWEHAWVPAVAILQPALIANGDVLLASHDGMSGIGMRRIAVARKADGWTVEERWTSRGLKPYFSDVVVHKGHAFGVDGSILACINLEDGTRKWKGGRYGGGQLVLLPDQDLLLVLSEEGELALVKATPDQFTEVARFKAIESKTWNHPVVVGDVVLVRNGEEMAAFRLSLAGR